MEGAGIGEFGGRLNNAPDDHGDDKVALGEGVRERMGSSLSRRSEPSVAAM